MRRSPFYVSLLLALCAATMSLALDTFDSADTDDMRLLRMPDIHGDLITFIYGGDVWTVASTGGEARRLTSDIGYEMSPKFSPDGATIAFTASYDGNADVYVIPAEGGEPVRLTWHPGQDRMIDWQPDGKALRFQTRRVSHTGRDLQLFTVPLKGGLPERIILPTAGLSSYSPDGDRIAYNRISREERTWKRYKGGMAQDIWIYDFDRNTTEQVTNWAGSDNYPMWHGDTIYFNSDRTGRLQIWSHDLKTGNEKQLTHHDEYDVKYPSLGETAIVYENGGRLHVLDLETEKSTQITVSLHYDAIHTRPALKSVGDMIRGMGLSPDANRAVAEGRGDIFTLPAEHGNVRNLTSTPGIFERNPAWSPDGKQVAYFSDRDDEYQVYLRPGDGSGEEKQLTDDLSCFPQQLAWSPDSKHLLVTDASMRLLLVDAEDGDVREIDQSVSGEINGFAWSPHSDWVAYAKASETGFGSIYLYELDGGGRTEVTTYMTNDGDPTFDADGKYLFFTSDRHFNPQLGGFDLKPFWTHTSGLYMVCLKADAENPFAPESDEVEVKDDAEDDDADKKDEDDSDDAKDEDDEDDEAEEEEDPKTEIDLDGIGNRIVALDVQPGNYFNLQAGSNKLFYMSRPLNPGARAFSATLMMFDMEEKESKTVMSGLFGYELAANGEKLLYAMPGSFGIVSAAADQTPSEHPLRTSEMMARVDPRLEWQEMFRDAWRLERDFFYDPDMHGVDWKKMYRRYGQLVPYVAHRADLNYVFGELLGELCSSHSYVGGGDMPTGNRIQVGLLGCDFAHAEDGDRYIISRILDDRNWNGGTETPLHIQGNEVHEGEYLLAVDGVELKAPTNPYAFFENKVDKQVVLKIGPNANGDDSREITVVPIAREFDLRYEAWVQDNRHRVDELSDGRIGYLHLPNTAVGGQQGFVKGYYPNLRKEGLIVDERFNGGGFIPDFFMNIMRQKLVNLWKPRYGQDWRTPNSAFMGHLAMVSNGYAGSGGDALPYYFKYYELGEVVGTRTWGGLVGVSRRIPLMDGGGVTMPEFGLFDVEGEWDVENYGVDPTIEIDNLPHEEINGRDPQLEKAVEVLLQKIADEPVSVPSAPRFPRDK